MSLLSPEGTSSLPSVVSVFDAAARTPASTAKAHTPTPAKTIITATTILRTFDAGDFSAGLLSAVVSTAVVSCVSEVLSAVVSEGFSLSGATVTIFPENSESEMPFAPSGTLWSNPTNLPESFCQRTFFTRPFFYSSQVLKSSFTSPPVSPELALKHQTV